MCADDQDNGDDYVEQVLGTYRGVPNLTTGESPFFLVYGRDGNQPVHQLRNLEQCSQSHDTTGSLVCYIRQ